MSDALQEELAGSKEELDALKAIFKKFDKNGDNTLSKDELKQLLKGMPPFNVTDKDVDLVMMKADKNENGVVEMDEFLDYIFKRDRDVRTSVVAQTIEKLDEVMEAAGLTDHIAKARLWKGPERIKSVDPLFEDPTILEQLCEFIGLDLKQRRKLRMTYANLFH